MTLNDVIQVAQNAGFQGESLVTAVAVAWAESGLDSSNISDIDNPHKGCRSYGLWQINYCPDRDSGTRPPPSMLLQAQANANYAFTLSGGGANWGPWTVYREQTYKQYVDRVRAAINGGAGGTTTGTTSTANPSLQPCLDNCSKLYPKANDANDGTNFENRVNCMQGCYDAYGPLNGDGTRGTQQDPTQPCAYCSITNLPSCFGCIAQFATNGLTHIGVNILLALVVLIGVYLLFRDEINTTIVTAGKEAAKAAEVAAIA